MPKIIVGFLMTMFTATSVLAADVEPKNCKTYSNQRTVSCPSGSIGGSYTVRECLTCNTGSPMSVALTIPCTDRSTGIQMTQQHQGCTSLIPDLPDIPSIDAITCSDDDDCTAKLVTAPSGYLVDASAVCREPGTTDSYCETVLNAQCDTGRYGTPSCEYKSGSVVCSGCTPCPSGDLASDVITSPSGNSSIYECYLVQSDTVRTDTSGTYTYQDNCNYSDICGNEDFVTGITSTKTGTVGQITNGRPSSSGNLGYCWCHIGIPLNVSFYEGNLSSAQKCQNACMDILATNTTIRDAIGCSTTSGGIIGTPDIGGVIVPGPGIIGGEVVAP